MAEALLKRLGGADFEVASAGSDPDVTVHPQAVRVMNGYHVDIAGQRPKRLDEMCGEPWDYVIVTADEATGSQLPFSGASQRLVWHVSDPAAPEVRDPLAAFWRVANEIETRVRLFVNVARRQRAPGGQGTTQIERAVRELLDGAPATSGAPAANRADGAPRRVLFLCTHNSARSQMAEGWLRHVAGDRFDVRSAGTEATRVRPLAIRAMREFGVDISHQTSKTLERYVAESWDYVITVCDDANESCPAFPGGRERLHWSFPDPSKTTGSEDDQLAVYRIVRDAIRDRIDALVSETSPATPGG
jgi:arsenate reductase (thioredoxin)